MKKLLSLALIGALSLSLTACGNNSSKDNSSSKETTTTKKEEKKEPLDLTGEWQCDPTDGTYLKATISNGVIEIDWVFVEENKSAIYWVGSYDAPTTDTNEYSWVSNNDHEQTETSILASTDETKSLRAWKIQKIKPNIVSNQLMKQKNLHTTMVLFHSQHLCRA